jgi:E3 ubiquitin-protein ligase RNF19A
MRSSLESDVTPCVAGQRKKRFASRWSLRHLIYSSPILNRRRSQNSSGSSKSHRNHGGKDTTDSRLGGSSKDIDRGASHHVEIHQATSRTSVFTTSTKSGEVTLSMECPLCFAELAAEEFWELAGCGHRACISCLQQYLRVEITESRVCISCPECPEPMHPNGKKIHRRLPHLWTILVVRAVLVGAPSA